MSAREHIACIVGFVGGYLAGTADLPDDIATAFWLLCALMAGFLINDHWRTWADRQQALYDAAIRGDDLL